MKLDGRVIDAQVVAKKASQGIKDPNRTFYSLGIVKDEETGELSCTKDVYDFVKKNNFYDFGFCYNQAFDSLQLDQVLSDNGTLLERLLGENTASAEQSAAVPEPAEAEEKKEETSATTKSSKK